MWEIIEFIFAIIGFIGSIFTIISVIFPTQSYPIVKWIHNWINKRLLSKNEFQIILQHSFNISEDIEYDDFKENLKRLLKEYDFHPDIDYPYIYGNLKRRNHHISIRIDLPIEENILIKQEINIPFRNLKDGINTLFDIYRDFQKLDYIHSINQKTQFILSSNILSKSNLIKIFGDSIKCDDFEVTKFNNKYELHFLELDNQEAIDKIVTVILSFITS
ncbi:MAG: hypothetical protein Q4P18_07145 [Methanobrevibacter sp.]|uniref:hypothetical protein n=1 Tax=Methanobrevibacter sp. TaxID=66852 RepID=UPI0026DEA8FC|nr:hypothetical protein [Methanobrevibacter sp.]MDO5849293.1 hypothetical protein [Methanobrevibacter sp.]